MNKVYKLIVIFTLCALYGCRQTAVPSINCEYEEITLGYEASTFTFHYNIDNPITGTRIEVLTGESWISKIETTDETISFYYSENDTDKEREATMQISYGNRMSTKTIKIRQSEAGNVEYIFDITGINDYQIDANISVKDQKRYYIYGVEKYETYLRFVDDTYFIEHRMALLEKEADMSGMTVEEIIESQKVQGTEDVVIDHLEPEREYIIYAIDIDESGLLGTFMEKKIFTTKEPIKFDVEMKINGPVVTFNTTPSYDNRRYLVFPLTKDECDHDKTKVKDVLMELFSQEMEYMMWYSGLTEKEYLDWVTSFGPSNKIMELYPECEYYVTAICLDEMGLAASEVTIMEMSTGPVVPSDNKITITISEITGTTAHYKVTTTTEDTYLFFIDAVSNWEGKSDQDIINEVSLIPTTHLGRIGDCEGTIQELEPETDYFAFAFGCVAFTPTTDLVKVYFTTTDDPNSVQINRVEEIPIIFSSAIMLGYYSNQAFPKRIVK